MDIQKLKDRVEAHGFCVRGLVSLEAQKTGVLVGNVGGALWPHFKPHSSSGPNPLDQWTKKVLGEIARDLGAEVLFPFEGPPFQPFQRWAQWAEPVFPSPIGPLVHPNYGLWHAYRGLLVFKKTTALPAREQGRSPCETCQDKPCLTTCPVSAFTPTGYDVPACTVFLKSPGGTDCMARGCAARRACPIGLDHSYPPEMAQFHMVRFLRSFG